MFFFLALKKKPNQVNLENVRLRNTGVEGVETHKGNKGTGVGLVDEGENWRAFYFK